MQSTQITGFRAFMVMWAGQFVSLIGSAMTRFAITIWAFEQTESATVLALVGFFSFGPTIIATPFAGAMVDRWNRKAVMIIADLGAGLSTLILYLLLVSGNLEIWHLYIAGIIGGTFEAFQFPAFSAAVTMMVDKKHYARASGLQSLAQSASTVAAPLFAGMLLAASGLKAVMLVDIATFLVAVSTLTAIFVPQPAQSETGKLVKKGLLSEAAFGFRYMWARRSLFGMQMMFFFANLFIVMTLILIAPLVLSKTDHDAAALGVVEAAAGIGGVVGGLALGVWGGPTRKVHGVFLGMAASGIFGRVVIGLGDSVLVWSAGMFLMWLFLPMVNGSNQAIWQTKVPPDVQGRVFGARRLIAQVTTPVGMLLAGFLADKIFEPAMEANGWLAPIFGGLVGTGAGSGIAVIMIVTGALGTAAGLMGYAFPFIRNIEEILPDYEAIPAPEAVAENVTLVEPQPASASAAST